MANLPDRQHLRDTWLHHLAADFYPQGHFDLAWRNHAGAWCFCPLGAACEVFLELGGVLQVVDLDDVRIYEGERYGLPEQVRLAFGFHSVLGDRHPPGDDVSLPALNDRAKLSLPQIAAIIRKNPAAYFVD